MKLVISKNEIMQRRERVIKIMRTMGIDALYITPSANIAYLTNFFFISTERPIAAIIKQDGETIMFAPIGS